MIIEWIMQVGSGFVGWVATLFPELEIPAEIADADETINGVLSMGDGLGVWIDWGFASIVFGICLTVWVAGLAIRAIRVGLSHIPFVGGRG